MGVRLARALELHNFNIIIDQTHLRIGGNTKLFMRLAIEESDVVLIVLTPNYADKAMNRRGGVGFEYAVINRNLLQTIDDNEKYLPVLRSGDYTVSIPEYLQIYKYCDMRDDSAFDLKIQELADRINGIPITLDSLLTDDDN